MARGSPREGRISVRAVIVAPAGSCLCSFSCFPANHADRVAAAQLQDAIFATPVASHCLLVLAVPPARVFCRRYSRTGLPYSRKQATRTPAGTLFNPAA